MYTKRQKKLISHLMRDNVRRRRERELNSMREFDHRVSDKDGEGWTDFGIWQWENADLLVQYIEHKARISWQELPDYDCSGRPFIDYFYICATHIPNEYGVIMHYSLAI